MASTAVHASASTAAAQARHVSTASFALGVLLLAQYILGMAYNLYGTAPTATKSVAISSSPLLATHVILGTLLILFAIYLVFASIRAGMRIAVVTSVIALLSIIAAWLSGSSFARSGASGASMSMAVLTAVALLCSMTIVMASGAARAK